MFRKPSYLLILAYVLLILAMFILPLFSMEGYSMIRHTVIQLGAQQSPNAWAFNGILILLGLGSIWAGRGLMYGFFLQRISLTIFGLALALTGLFSTAPIDPSLDLNQQEAQLHFVFTNLSWIAFTVLAVSMVFMLESSKDKLLAWCMAGLSVLMSLGIYLIPELAGIFQRLLFIGSFGWLIYLFGFKEE